MAVSYLGIVGKIAVYIRGEPYSSSFIIIRYYKNHFLVYIFRKGKQVRPYLYAILFAVIVLVVKAFYLDSYLKTVRSDENTSTETVETKPVASVEPEKSETNETNESNLTVKERFERDSEQSIIDRGVDWLADKLAQKLQ